MNSIDEYWSNKSAVLRTRFADIRATHPDSDVKGHGNEQVMATFLRENLAHRTIATNTTIFDSSGKQSDEVDVAICNEYQPFVLAPQPSLLLVEGVDAIIQIKARLDKAELKRIVGNCQTVKQLKRSLNEGDMMFAHEHDVEHFAFRVPYIAFAFESAITAETASSHLVEMLQSVPTELQPDGVFVLDKFSIANIRKNDGTLRATIQPGEEVPNLAFDKAGSRTLSQLMWTIYAVSTTFYRMRHPLLMYAPPRPDSGVPTVP